jgi:hypothetical protein
LVARPVATPPRLLAQIWQEIKTAQRLDTSGLFTVSYWFDFFTFAKAEGEKLQLS